MHPTGRATQVPAGFSIAQSPDSALLVKSVSLDLELAPETGL